MSASSASFWDTVSAWLARIRDAPDAGAGADDVSSLVAGMREASLSSSRTRQPFGTWLELLIHSGPEVLRVKEVKEYCMYACDLLQLSRDQSVVRHVVRTMHCYGSMKDFLFDLLQSIYRDRHVLDLYAYSRRPMRSRWRERVKEGVTWTWSGSLSECPSIRFRSATLIRCIAESAGIDAPSSVACVYHVFRFECGGLECSVVNDTDTSCALAGTSLQALRVPARSRVDAVDASCFYTTREIVCAACVVGSDAMSVWVGVETPPRLSFEDVHSDDSFVRAALSHLNDA